MKQWANLDFLRSIAVVLVAMSHLFYYTGHLSLVGWGGTVGVAFFFVHTSLVLMWSLERDSHVGRFYVRRAFRIYPLWWVVFFLVVLIHIPVSPLFAPSFGSYTPAHLEWLWEITLLFNIHYGASVMGASWSLPLEVEMYLVLPFLFFFVRSVRKLWPFLVIDGFLCLYDWFQFPPESSALPMCIPYFLGGVMAYQLSKTVRARIPAWLFPIFLCIAAAIGFRYGGYRANWLLCLALGLALPHFRQMTWAPLLRCCHLIAKYSYGIYLCHIPAIAVGFYYLRGHSKPVQILGFLLTIVIVPVFLYHAVEEPMIRLGSRVAKKIETGRAPAMNAEALNMEPAP